MSKKMTKYTQERMLLKHKPRKILNLEERVQAIRMYDEIPIYQRVALAFKCSWEQIKTIIANRKEILKYYASCQIIDVIKDDPKVVRHKKINFLGNCMYEYIKRAHFHRLMKITDDVIREKALEFRDIIKIEKFYPNRAWITDFKSVFNIDLEQINQIIITRKPPRSLSCQDIIAYCAKEVDNALSSKPGKTNEDVKPNLSDLPPYTEDEKKTIKIPTTTTTSLTTTPIATKETATAILRQLLTENEIKQEKPDKADNKTSSTSTQSQQQIAPKRLCTSTSTITNYQEALEFMRPLEDFALAQEDFKAINLLNQLAQLYEKSTKRKRFH
uniref:HTH CENPB-type domain-containing protein n=1 Tax=Glossina palpalis gambiensis TaxID=67801 RepID=A0A1B0AQ79_9MUSC